MSLDMAKAYKNFLKYQEEKAGKSKEIATPTKTGLLAPKKGAASRTARDANTSELDKVSEYVNQIRKHRMAMRNGE